MSLNLNSNCRSSDCYVYTPHTHPKRLDVIPSARIIFVCGNSDISFCPPDYVRKIIDSIKRENKKNPEKIYYFQSKNPKYFEQFLSEFPESVYLLTTLETNRDEGYENVSKAPAPSIRYRRFRDLSYPRKILTCEPLMQFDEDVFRGWLMLINPKYIYIGFNSKQKSEIDPDPEKVKNLIADLRDHKIKVKEKDLRGVK